MKINSSGTTGKAKNVNLDVKARFSTCKRVQYPENYTVGFFYDFNSWAGISVLIHCIKNKVSAVKLNYNSKELNSVDHICMTPTQCLYLLQTKVEYPLCRQVTLGGEYSKQKHLDAARTIFPNAKITHVYASTETGDICAVSDGLEGIPVEKFSKYTVLENSIIIGKTELKDVWTLRNGRYYFVKRSDLLVKIGNQKVNLEEMESSILDSFHEVSDCVLYTKKSPFGNIVLCLEYTGADCNEKLKKHFLQFTKPLRPLHYSLVPNLLTKNGKKQRRR